MNDVKLWRLLGQYDCLPFAFLQCQQARPHHEDAKITKVCQDAEPENRVGDARTVGWMPSLFVNLRDLRVLVVDLNDTAAEQSRTVGLIHGKTVQFVAVQITEIRSIEPAARARRAFVGGAKAQGELVDAVDVGCVAGL